MELLSHAEDCVIVVGGRGLIGSAVVDALSAEGFSRQYFQVNWSKPSENEPELARLRDTLAEGSYRRTTIVWAGMDAPFGIDRIGSQKAYDSFRGHLLRFYSMARDNVGDDVSVHLMSSAGGLFEGCRMVQPDQQPTPRRPYGELKLEQERFIGRTFGRGACWIYRPTSVYGHIVPGQRKGLISVLLINALVGRSTTVTGDLGTLRDYVFSQDIGRFIALKVRRADAAGAYLLCSGRPTSIFEMKNVVKSILNREVYLSFAPQRSNWMDTTFSPSQRPSDWLPTDVRSNLPTIAARLVSSGALRVWV